MNRSRSRVLAVPGRLTAYANKETAVFAILLALALLMPFFIHFQPVTGTTVNAVLFIATVLLGSVEAAVIGFLPSVIALSVGQLPFVLAPMVPFIIASNIILVAVFHALWRRSFFLGVAAASVAKFAFLQFALWVALRFFITGKVAVAATMMMSWPQLMTALAGGVLAYAYLKSAGKQIKA